jgi:hypothetical protein
LALFQLESTLRSHNDIGGMHKWEASMRTRLMPVLLTLLKLEDDVSLSSVYKAVRSIRVAWLV